VASLVIVLFGIAQPSFAGANLANAKGGEKGTLSDNRVIESDHLGYKLQYRVYLPPDHDSRSELPVIYLTDGQWYIEPGSLPRLLDKMIGAGKIKPVVAVFLDNRDPENLKNNRRNREFLCNRDYIKFVSEELAGEIDRTYNTRANRDGRTILGLSFGGLNSACFGLYGHESFRGIAMQSPALHPVDSLLSDFRDAPKRDLKIFLSTGTVRDNQDRTRQFKRVLKKRGYELLYKEVPFGHDWNNWKPLLDDILRYFYAVKDPIPRARSSP